MKKVKTKKRKRVSSTSSHPKKKLKITTNKKSKDYWVKYVRQFSSSLWNCEFNECSNVDKSIWQYKGKGFKSNCWFSFNMKMCKQMVKINKTNQQWLYLFKETILKTKNELNEDNDTKAKNSIKVKPRNNEGKTKEEAERTWKVRLYPSKKQNERLKRMFGIFRWTYYQCVAYYKELNEKYENKKDVPNDEKANLSNLRLRFVNKDGIEKMKKGWVFN